MLLRSEFFLTMFCSPFREAQLKAKAALVISTLGSGGVSQAEAAKTHEISEEEIDIYDIVRAAWLTRVQRLEEFCARYLAYRLEAHIDSPEFAELIMESANRIQKRQETDSIELLDDIRFYLSERFRLRFDDAGLEEMMEEQAEKEIENVNAINEGIKDITNGVEQLDIPSWGEATVDAETLPAVREAQQKSTKPHDHGPIIRTLDGQIAGDEFDSDAINYQILLDKLDGLLEKLNLDA